MDRKQEVISLGDDSPLTVNKLEMKTAEGRIMAWYWFSAGGRFVSNFYHQQAYLILDALRGSPLKGALIRVSVWGKSPQLALENKAKSFIRQAVPYLKEIL